MVSPLEGEGTLEIYVTGLDIENKNYKISKMEIVFNQVEKAHSAYHHSNQKWTTLQL